MSELSKEKDKKENMNSSLKYDLNINFKNRNNLISVDFDISISELKKIIFEYFKISHLYYDLFYKNTKINFNDNRPISLLFEIDYQNPLLFIIEKNKKENLISKKAIYTAEIRTKYSLDKVKLILDKFFEFKRCPNDAIIKPNLKEIYEIKFRKSIMAKEFKQYFDVNYNNKLKHSPMKINLSSSDIKNNSNLNKKMNSIIYKNEKDSFEESEFPIKYIKSNNNKIMDTKIWLYEKGFINNTNKCNINNNYHFIKNYVAATPSNPPLLHKFRNVSKNLWLNKKGFYL